MKEDIMFIINAEVSEGKLSQEEANKMEKHLDKLEEASNQ